LFENILDPQRIESQTKSIQGFARFKGDIIFQKEKIVQKGTYNLFGIMVNGYEIHNGIAKKRAQNKKKLYGTFVHGLFDNDALRHKLFTQINPNYKGYNFQKFKKKATKIFATHIENHINMNLILKAIYE
jgi:adenosylcobyric acid synthase